MMKLRILLGIMGITESREKNLVGEEFDITLSQLIRFSSRTIVRCRLLIDSINLLDVPGEANMHLEDVHTAC
jgi:hypothetical protein